METLQTPYGSFNVYVNALYSEGEHLIHISFVDNKNQLHVVLMQESGGQWMIANQYQLAGWIISLQSKLETLISRELLRQHLAIAV